LDSDTKDDADRIFRGLAEGGKITMPLADTFWGSYFGMVNDKFGVQWMVSFSKSR
jgi:PhnB protein